MPSMPAYDVVIIGSGLGGLLCGAMLSREGMKVCILEQHHQIGGCLQTFVRDGCVFDTGIQYIGSMDEGQVLNRYFTYFGLTGKLRLKRLDQEGFDRISFSPDGPRYPHAMGPDQFTHVLAEYFPAERQAIAGYVRALKQVCDAFGLFSLQKRSDTHQEQKYRTAGAHAFLQSVTRDPTLRNVLAGSNLLYAGDAQRTPLHVHALVNYSYIQSAYRLIDSSARIAALLEQSILEHGGELHRNHEAVRFIFHDRALTGVECSNGERFEGSRFISDVHPARTLAMIPPDKISRIYRDRVTGLRNTTSAFIVYLSLHKNTLPYDNYNLYLHRHEDVWTSDAHAPGEWPAHLFCFTPAPSHSETFADSLVLIAYMHIEEVKRWEHSTIEQRGEEYRQFKRDKTELVLRFAERHMPGIRAAIRSVYTSTPLTYRDYTGTIDGSMYGIARDYHEPLRSAVSHRTRIHNLLLTGQNTNMHGALGVTIGAVVTCSDILGAEYLVGKIAAA